MHEFKHGELRSGTSEQKVKSRRQAVAIALSEAGASMEKLEKFGSLGSAPRPTVAETQASRWRDGTGLAP